MKDYYGNYNFEINKYFINFSFDILNNGFKNFLYYFSLILNPQFISVYFDNFIEEIALQLQYDYINKININNKEWHILEYFVYGLKGDNNEELLPEGNFNSISKIGLCELKKKVLDYIYKLIDPANIKITIFSKYKFLISAKYMKKYFNYLTTMKKKYNEENNEKQFDNQEFNKSQIFYIENEYYNPNFLEIIYYIDKVKNESYSELYYKANYLNYIIDFINEKKEGSLYYLLTNNSNFNIKSITAGYDIALKSKIELIINIELNCLKNINDIIFITYQYIHKIIKEAIGENLQMDRYLELKNKFYQSVKYSDKTFNTKVLAKNNAEQLFLSKYNRKYFFYNYFVPWNDNDNYIDNEKNIKEESSKYFKQLRPENSVIVLGIKNQDKDKLTCNNNSKFYLNCSYFKNENNSNTTTYYYVKYIKDVFNASNFEKDLDINNKANISFIKNTYISKHNESFIDINKEKEKNITQINKDKNLINKFYFKRNTNFTLPRVYISLNLYHPYLRPILENINETKCYYFKIIEIFSAIKRKTNEVLVNAIRAGNEIQFERNENNLCINIFCYEDVAYEIMKKIKYIIYDLNWELTDFKSNNEIYKNEAFQDFFIYNRNYIADISKYYFFSILKKNFFNTYEFFPDDFENEYYQKCINNSFDSNEFKNLTSFIIKGYIYGYYTKEQAEKISNLFEINNTKADFNNLLWEVNNTEVLNKKNDKTIQENFIDWINEIKELTHYEQVTINPKICNKSTISYYNIGYSYERFDESELDAFLFESILEKTDFHQYLKNLDMLKYKNIFFHLILANDDNISETVPNDNILNTSWQSTLDNMHEYNDDVDNIGNRYYYVKKNFVLTLYKRQVSLRQRANDEIQGHLYEGTAVDTVKMMDDYNIYKSNKKFNKTELNETIKHFSNILGRKRIDIIIGEG